MYELITTVFWMVIAFVWGFCLTVGVYYVLEKIFEALPQSKKKDKEN